MTRTAENGFILPLVLAVIAVIAAIAAYVGAVVYNAQQTVYRLQRNNEIEKALFASEAKAIFVILTAPPAPGGFIASGRDISVDAYALGDAPTEFGDLDEGEIWRVNGEKRRDAYQDIDVLVALQDINGLISLESTGDRALSAFLQTFNISEREAESLIAKLRDYTDDDDLRRYLGAERADYRLRSAPPPTNAVLRSLQELKQVAGWSETGLPDDFAFQSLTTVRRTTIMPLAANMPEELLDRAPSDGFETDVDDEFAAAITGPIYPTSRLRIRLTAVDRVHQIGVERLIEVQRRPDAADIPYERVLIYERPLTASAIQEMSFDDVPPVIEPAS